MKNRSKLIADLKRSHDELLDARNYLDDIVHSLMDSLIVATPDGKIERVNAAIRLPFVLEAAVSAFGGGVFASLGLVAVKVFLIDGTLTSTFRFTTFIGWDVILWTVPVVIGTGVLLAVVAASVTLRRYLRV